MKPRSMPVRIAVTALASTLMLATAACGTREAPETAPAPPPPVAEPVAAADPPPRDIRVCVVDEQGMRVIAARYDPATGDTLVEGRPFAEAYPTTGRYAEAAPWYIDNEPVEVDSAIYTKYGLPRVLLPGELVRRRDYRGVMMLTETADTGDPYMIWYAAVRPNCEFHPYQGSLVAYGVRG
jgi:hypothetical protein